MFKLIIKRVLKNKFAVAGLIFIFIVFFIAIFANNIAPYDPYKINVYKVLEPPSKEHILGTDELGRDVLSRIIYGARVSLKVGFIAMGIAILTGTILGLIAGYYGGFIDTIIMRFVDVMLAFPTLFLILAVVAVLEPSIYIIMVVIGLTGWMDVARLVRAEVLSLKEREFVLAARAIGASSGRIIFKHILPNAIYPVIVAATFSVGGAILIESGLSFLGLGIQPPEPSWGGILSVGKDYITVAWWMSLFPGIAIFLTVLSFNLLGEALRDALDPKQWAED
ncbi:MAG: ABC transporter permease [Thermodesulfovibrio sp.]|uniref:oligopeptide ABC transporter permease n=1 Tax=unclassified Thermodesulfovibrio TaxID=2645936 RepID=UPI00083A580A|nr:MULTISPECIES: oligopeptide ABC transporter permease [unclassified Thermodesulfovibrio]MDI1472511.1 ABC transporter permease [Thermodesulfovibrio sp. 1176]MDI6714452.1 ABC transporter permease [Thermodesulfovibrio sp.]ODA43713.1 Dipeptide transport system permease protein DppC [Thermodesulfovibrio sp. N1]